MELTESTPIPAADPGMKKTTFPAACRAFFGVRAGDGLKEFAAELKALTLADRQELVILFKNVGYDVTLAS